MANVSLSIVLFIYLSAILYLWTTYLVFVAKHTGTILEHVRVCFSLTTSVMAIVATSLCPSTRYSPFLRAGSLRIFV